MRKHTIRFSVALAGVMALLAATAVPSMATDYPVIETEAATDVHGTSATLHATIDTGGVPALYGFAYSEEPEPTNEGTGGKKITTSKPTQVSWTVTDLNPETKYYFHAGAVGMEKNAGNTDLGEELTFTTDTLRGLSVDENEFSALTYPAGISGDPQESTFSFNVGEDKFNCTIDYTSTITEGVATLPLDVEASGCTAGEWGSASLAMNSCRLDLAAASLFGRAKVSCEKAEDAIEVSVNEWWCTFSIPAEEFDETSSALYVPYGEGEGARIYASILDAVSYEEEGLLCSFFEGPGSISGSVMLEQSE